MKKSIGILLLTLMAMSLMSIVVTAKGRWDVKQTFIRHNGEKITVFGNYNDPLDVYYDINDDKIVERLRRLHTKDWGYIAYFSSVEHCMPEPFSSLCTLHWLNLEGEEEFSNGELILDTFPYND